MPRLSALPLLAIAFAAVTLAPGRLDAAEPLHPAPSAHDLALVNALTWGANASTMARFQAVGVERWLADQLHPPVDTGLPATAQGAIDAAMPGTRSLFDAVTAFDQQGREANQIGDPEQKKAAQQAFQQALNAEARAAASAAILRALYAPDQLRERMAWFWFNHFNIHQYKANIRVMLGDYEARAIRPHALGRFRDLLAATLSHPAMLRYLDNADNAAGRINENYAREIMELHTLGVGSGYTQHDVEELARILTGVGIDARPENPRLRPELQAQLVRNGLFEFNPARHDYGDKVFLGQPIKGRGFAEVEEALDILVRQPATATRVARQIATYFVADTPPETLVRRMAEAFRQSDGDIAAVLAAMIRAPEFSAAIDAAPKFKDPVRFVFSAVRLAYDDRVILNTTPVQNWLNRLSQGLYNHATPDGYPLASPAWSGPGQMMVRFEIARQIGSGTAGLFKPEGPNATEEPAFPLLQNALYFNGLRQRLGASTSAALTKAISPQDWNTLFLSSPEFMH
ncbi:MAG: DUF1800 domain-containing protein [Phreatobacter sp.]